jgi:hypothetical protein
MIIKSPCSLFLYLHSCKVASGFDHCLALSKCGRVFAWGWGADGQLGFDDSLCEVPRLISDLHHVSKIFSYGDSSFALSKVPYIYDWITRNDYHFPPLLFPFRMACCMLGVIVNTGSLD